MANTIVSQGGLKALTPAADQTAKEGYFVELSAANTGSVSNSATDEIIGCIVEGEDTDGQSTVALFTFPGEVKVKLSGTVALGDRLQLHTDGTVITDAATGARRIVAIAHEEGVTGDLITAQLIGPLIFAS
jgi:hypothetical protein